jgi:hypothetical protein
MTDCLKITLRFRSDTIIIDGCPRVIIKEEIIIPKDKNV